MNVMFPKHETGAVLVIGLMMLVVLTLIGVTGMQSASLQTLMSQASADKTLAFQAAEAALRKAEESLDAGDFIPEQFSHDDNDGLFENEFDAVWKQWTNSDWQQKSIAVEYPELPSSNEPRYIIQRITTIIPHQDQVNVYQAYGEVKDVGDTELFRITARGTGASDKTIVYLESLHGARF